MCGISGFCDFNKRLKKETLEKMTDALSHRGPNDKGYSFYESQLATIGLGHRRLAILDLSKQGHQPMVYENYEIVYNGEVYNFKEIKVELEKHGYIFESESDTEVILKAYHKWGIKAVDRFNGMFAISIYDKNLDKIICIRDRAGVKPFYYFFKNGLFLFSSELKSFYTLDSFKKDINIESVKEYLKFGYIPQPLTIFKDTYKLESGNYLELDLKTKEITKQNYWNVKDFYAKDKLDISFNEALDETEKLLVKSFDYRMISDVPVGVFLSGGYDSSAVSAILKANSAQKIKTFTIGFKEENYNEAIYAKKVANHLGTDHHEHYLSQKDALEILPTLSEIYDEPFGDSSSIPTIMVSQFAKKHVSVSLSADGGDELFSGYPSYSKIHNMYNNFPKSDFLKQIANIDRKINPYKIGKHMNIYNFEGKFYKFFELLKNNNNPSAFYNTNTKYFYDTEIEYLLHQNVITSHYYDKNTLDNMLMHSFNTYLNDDILTKVDRATMSVSLEGREPLLDYKLIEFVAQLPTKYKQHGNETKYILKEIVHKYIPKEMMDRKKMGFSIPIFEWFKEELKIYFEEYLSEKFILESAIFDYKYIDKMKKSYFKGNGNPHKLWLILMFQMWWFKWIK